MYINPYDTSFNVKGVWLKSNFHTHAGTGRDTCGAYEIDDVVTLYKEAGYSVLTISNHDIFSDVSYYQMKNGITILNGYEYSQDPHMLCIGVSDVVTGTHQEAIDECLKQGGFAILCHPNWQRKEYWPWEAVDALHGYTGIEIYNGVIFRLDGTGLATDTWDYLLSQGKLAWGFGSDDFHRWYDLARAWNVIYSQSNKHEHVKASVRSGSFYVSTGLILTEFAFNGGKIKITAVAKDTYIKEYKYIFIGKNGQVLDEQYGEHGEYQLKGNEPYVRVQIISEHGAMLWTQPVYKNELFQRP